MYNDLKTLLEIVGMTDAMQRRISMALRLGLISQGQAAELTGEAE